MRSEREPRKPLGLRIAAIGGLLFLHLPLAADHPLRLHHRGEELPVPAARLHHANGSPSPGSGPTSGRRSVSRSRSRRSRRCSRWCSARSPPRRCRARSFFGREAISLLFVLPIALPGIITGISLRSAFDLVDIPFSFWTIVLGHATFCIVVVYNNAVARFRRTSGADRGVDGSRRRRLPDLPLRGPAATSPRRCSPAACSPSRCRSTR